MNNLPLNPVGGVCGEAGGVCIGVQGAPPANFTVGAVGFAPHWASAEDAMAASIVRLEQENEELRAEAALLREQARILQAERDEALKVMHETRRRLDDEWLEIEQLKKDRELLKRQRDDGWQEIKRLTKGVEKWT